MDESPTLSELLEQVRVAGEKELREQGYKTYHEAMMDMLIGDPGPDVINLNIKTTCDKPKRERPDFHGLTVIKGGKSN
jgi:hypothetical protein